MGIALATRGGDKPIEGSGNPKQEPSANASAANSAENKKQTFLMWGVRYQVREVDRSVTFYTQHLGFKLEQRSGSAFASVSNEGFTVLLSGPGSSGARPMPDGRQQEPGGWNRIVLRVDDLTSLVATMKKAGLHFRNEIETGPGGKQIQLEDPDGNAIELFEPASKAT